MAMQLKGREVFRMAVTSAQHDIKEVVSMAGLELSDIDHFLLHQANQRIIDVPRSLRNGRTELWQRSA